jgi:hypothetical protein
MLRGGDFGEGRPGAIIKYMEETQMRKKDAKPDEAPSKTAAPLGFMSFPPHAAMFDDSDTYIIITNRKTAERVIKAIFSPKGNSTIPQ